MPEFRTDWLTGRTVIIAENRANRPNEFHTAARSVSQTEQATDDSGRCFFCPGHEDRTPASVYEVTDAQGKWQVRVVPNKFPAVVAPAANAALTMPALNEFPVEDQAATRAHQASLAAIGAHEVFIESPRHISQLSMLSIAELSQVLQAYGARLRHWRSHGGFAYGLIFKNQGPFAGASLLHLHSQFIALPTVPTAVNEEISRAEQESRTYWTCSYCRVIEREVSSADRLVWSRDGFVAICPYASLQPYETWVLPSRHTASFEDMRPEELDRLATVLHDLIVRLESVVPEAAYNLLLRTAPWCSDCGDWFHWRLEILPRVSAVAGLELATGIFINSVAPERAASKLRSL
jgi:UDPglucose--hexose-1-phosphate uridylyltransferase